MKTMTSSLSVLMVVVLALGGCNGTQTAGAGAQPIVIHQQIYGDDASLDRGLHRLRSAQAMDYLEVEQLAELEVDFDRQEIIVVALGEQESGGYWAHVDGAQVVDGELQIIGRANRPGPEQSVTQALTYPFAAVVIDRVDREERPLALLSQVQGEPLPGEGEEPAGEAIVQEDSQE